MRLALPALRADYRAAETYRPQRVHKVNCPVVALVGDEDPRVPIDEARAWRQHTSADFDLRVFPGGHLPRRPLGGRERVYTRKLLPLCSVPSMKLRKAIDMKIEVHRDKCCGAGNAPWSHRESSTNGKRTASSSCFSRTHRPTSTPMYGKPQACVRRRRSTSSTTDGQRPKESVRGRKATHWNTVQPPFRSPSFRAVGGSPGSPAARAGSRQRRGPALVDVLAVRRGNVHKTHTGSYPLKTVRIRLIRRVSSSERPPKSRKPSGPEGFLRPWGCRRRQRLLRAGDFQPGLDPQRLLITGLHIRSVTSANRTNIYPYVTPCSRSVQICR